MTKRKYRVNLAAPTIMRGKRYPRVCRKVVEWVDHTFEDYLLYVRVRSRTEPSCAGESARSCD